MRVRGVSGAGVSGSWRAPGRDSRRREEQHRRGSIARARASEELLLLQVPGPVFRLGHVAPLPFAVALALAASCRSGHQPGEVAAFPFARGGPPVVVAVAAVAVLIAHARLPCQ